MSPTRRVLVLLAALLALLLAAAAASARQAAAAPEETGTEDFLVPTADGAAVALHHHPGAGPPVIVVHGISSNHHCWDLDLERSLAVALVRAGLDAWLLDLRGHGDALATPDGRPLRSGWTVDDYGRYDVDAAIDFVRARTGSPRVGYVGHSMGGMVAAIYQAWHGDAALCALSVVGSPVDFSDPEPRLAWSGRLMALGAALSRVDTPAMARIAARMRRSPLGVDRVLFAPGSISPEARRRMYERIVSPLSRRELRQFARMVRTGRFTSANGAIDYLEALSGLRVPLLAVAGAADRVAPPHRVRPWVEQASSAERRWVLAGTAAGFSHDYGHLDLPLGDRAPEEIHPLLVEWTRAHCGVRPEP